MRSSEPFISFLDRAAVGALAVIALVGAPSAAAARSLSQPDAPRHAAGLAGADDWRGPLSATTGPTDDTDSATDGSDASGPGSGELPIDPTATPTTDDEPANTTTDEPPTEPPDGANIDEWAAAQDDAGCGCRGATDASGPLAWAWVLLWVRRRR